MIPLKLDPELMNRLDRIASAKRVTRSAYIIQILVERLDQEKEAESPWELGKKTFGRRESGQNNLAMNRKSIMKVKIRL